MASIISLYYFCLYLICNRFSSSQYELFLNLLHLGLFQLHVQFALYMKEMISYIINYTGNLLTWYIMKVLILRINKRAQTGPQKYIFSLWVFFFKWFIKYPVQKKSFGCEADYTDWALCVWLTHFWEITRSY